ncbi:hypothetical protein H9651_03400 [Microbacterium sp. Sa4CUA7]|uniref:Nitrate ABC transporter substrate-binding protein n=1 Tax=Microbacterium pullorum TaxID=2762236 RepID=A0ABR8RZM6_9MICO|nr:hypothetical protein [Microbacterium pullorum]MBD7956676.1 hypothetical protein [Microbacterium pullorum]
MPSPRLRRPAAATALLFTAALVFTACATPEPEVPSGTPAPTVGSADTSSPTATPEPEKTSEPVAAPDCSALISPATVEGFESLGWTSREEPFAIGAAAVPDGIQCQWADFAVPGGPMQIFGWAPIDAKDAQDAQEELLSAGWVRENGDAGVYISESPQMALATDAEGYGMTYLFGDGWVTLADTKQSLLLIENPVG